VVEIAIEQIQNQSIRQINPYISMMCSYDDVKKISQSSELPAPSCTIPKQIASEIIAAIEKAIAASNISLINIRFNGKNDDIKKCKCGGDLSSQNGKTSSITYTAQFTENGDIYVEVDGL
jgi:uncharacterized protein YxeA